VPQVQNYRTPCCRRQSVALRLRNRWKNAIKRTLNTLMIKHAGEASPLKGQGLRGRSGDWNGSDSEGAVSPRVTPLPYQMQVLAHFISVSFALIFQAMPEVAYSPGVAEHRDESYGSPGGDKRKKKDKKDKKGSKMADPTAGPTIGAADDDIGTNTDTTSSTVSRTIGNVDGDINGNSTQTTGTSQPTTAPTNTNTTSPSPTAAPTVETYNCYENNPCLDAAERQVYYYRHPDPTKFVQCGAAATCFTMSCHEGLVWSLDDTACVFPAAASP